MFFSKSVEQALEERRCTFEYKNKIHEAILELRLWAMDEFSAEKRIKASKIQKAAEKMRRNLYEKS
jgi:hypothetical protein